MIKPCCTLHMLRKLTIRVRIARVVLWLVLVCLINTVLDTGGFSKNLSAGEDLTVNDLESIYEWVLEDILDIEDAIPETDDHDIEKKQNPHSDWVAESFQEPMMIKPAERLFANHLQRRLPLFPPSLLCPPPEYTI